MFNPLKGLSDLNSMRQQAQAMQEALQKEQVEVNQNGIIVVMRGDQQVISVEVDGVMENRVAEAVNQAIKKTQEMAARKLMEISQQSS